MEADCLTHSKSAICSIVNVSSNPEVTVIARSVGAGGANVPADVRTIQAALNDVPSGRGGPSPALSVDGIIGPMTLAAIKRFQQAHALRVVDSRIDPNGPTLAALNAELDGDVPIAAQGLVGADAPQRRRKPEFLPPDPEIVATVATLLFKVRDVIRAANFRLSSADRFVTTRKLTIPTDPFLANARESLTMLDAVFGLGKFNNPRPPFENIKRVFRNMDVALNRSFETAPLIAPVLFVPNTHISMEEKAAAYTSVGGAFIAAKIKFKGLGEPADRIYVCRNFLTETPVDQVSALVHELAHYVSGQPIKIGDVVKQGRMLNSAFRPKFDAIKPEEKVASAEHYSFFSIVARFPKFLAPG